MQHYRRENIPYQLASLARKAEGQGMHKKNIYGEQIFPQLASHF